MKYRLLKNLPGIISGTIILEGSRLLEILDASDRDWFEPVNERIELSYGQTWLQSGWAISKKDGSEWTDEQQEKVIAALNNELYAEQEIEKAWDMFTGNFGTVSFGYETFIENLKTLKK